MTENLKKQSRVAVLYCQRVQIQAESETNIRGYGYRLPGVSLFAQNGLREGEKKKTGKQNHSKLLTAKLTVYFERP